MASEQLPDAPEKKEANHKPPSDPDPQTTSSRHSNPKAEGDAVVDVPKTDDEKEKKKKDEDKGGFGPYVVIPPC